MWKRVIAPTAVVSILWIAVSSATTYYVSQLIDAHTRTIAEDVPTIESAWAMRRDIWKLQAAILGMPHQSLAETSSEVAEVEKSFESSLTEADRTSLTNQEKEVVKTIRTQFQAYRGHLHEQLQLLASEPGRSITNTDHEQSMRLALTVTDSCRKLSEINQQLITDEADKSEKLYVLVVVIRLGFLILGPVIGLALGVWVARRLRTSITEISVTLRDVSGRLDGGLGSVAVSNSDELPALRDQVQSVADRIRQVIDELDEARQRVIQAERLAAVGELAASVAHEIRNPLTSVKLLIQTAAQRLPEPAMSTQHFEILLHEISRMEATIQGLLDFARPPRPRAICHDLRQTLRRALNLLQPRAQQYKVAIIEDFPTEAALVYGDPDQLHSVFVNLGINAIEAMPNGGTLQVAVAIEGASFRIEFRDTGSGFPLQLLDRVFEPFVTGKERGTGLGLAISRRIIEEHHGTLIAANGVQGGAVLTVELAISNTVAVDHSSIQADLTHSVQSATYEATNAKAAGY